MPVCSYLHKYSLQCGPQVCTNCGRRHHILCSLFKLVGKAGFWTHNWYGPQSYTVAMESDGAELDVFVDILKKAFPATSLEFSNRPLSGVEITLSGELPPTSDVTRLLEILKKHLTIIDSLDESHALSPHHLPPTPEHIRWKRTTLGNLVYSAKDYNHRKPVGSPGAANALVAELGSFLAQHPRYTTADLIICAPSSSRGTTDDLSSYVGTRLAKSLGKRIQRAQRLVDTPPQKDRENSVDEETASNSQRNSMVVRSQLNGSRCILIDDLYHSGGTLQELARACKRAGAVEVLGLTVTKTAKYTRGMDLDKWPRR